MTTLNKRYDAQVKALGDGLPGRFEAIVAVFDNVDLAGDRVLPGAFTKSLQRWRSDGDPIPVIWNHDWADPFSHIGGADPADVTETSKGLHVVGTLDVANNPKAAQVYALMRQRRVTEFSFSYAVDDEAPAKDGANNLKQVDLIEFGPTLKGMNPATELIGVKSAVGVHHTETYQGTWDAAANEARLPSEAAALRAAHAWVDPEGDPNAKSSYKFIHHTVSADGSVGGANLTACSATVAVLNGGRGGSSIPDGDRSGVHAHVAAHMVDSGMARPDVPPLKSEDGKTAGTLYVDIKPRIDVAAFEAIGFPPAGSPAATENGVALGAKAGRVISSKNEQKIRSAVKALEEVLASLGEATPPDGGASSDQAKAEEPPGAKAEEPDEVAHADPVRAQWAELTKGLG